MHFLLIPYIVLSAMFVVEFRGRAEPTERAGVLVVAALMAAMMFAVMTLRPVAGDSGRYYTYFLEIRDLELVEALEAPGFDALYRLLNWFVGRMGSAAWLLYGSALLLYFGVFIAALRQYVGRVATAALFVCYSLFPVFVTYGANGIRQGLALVFLLMACVNLKMGRRSAWTWLVLSPLWHSGAWLAVSVVLIHQTMCRFVNRAKLRWTLVLACLALAIVSSGTGLNEALLSGMRDVVELTPRHEAYFAPTEEVLAVGYQAGFRPDFLLFSLVPLVSAWALRRRAPTFSYGGSGWWLSLYVGMNIVYHLFSFVPYADRFAAFSWFLMPLVLFLQVREAARPTWTTRFVAAATLVNAFTLQLYTSHFIGRPGGW